MRMTDLAGIPIASTTPDEAASYIVASACDSSRAESFRFVNAYTVSLAQTDAGYAELLHSSGVNFPDGKPLAYALRRLLGRGDIEQIRGPSVFQLCLDRGRSVGLRHYFLGGTESLLAKLVERASLLYPGIEIAGTSSPPFRALTESELQSQDEDIRRSGAQLVWVGLGTPKQDFESERLCCSTQVSAAAVGAAFDFFAGEKREAPPWMSNVGLEWVYRLATEPRRLWRRYLVGNASFLRVVFMEKLRDRS